MKYQYFAHTFHFMIILIMSWSCTPDRDNPYDPKSPDYQDEGYLSGQVLAYYPPNNGLAGVEIQLVEKHVTVISTENGYFQFPPIAQGSYLLTANRSDFAPDSQLVHINPFETTSATFDLNGLPMFLDLSANTHFIDRWWPFPIYEVHFRVQASDTDGFSDLDSVFVEIPAFSVIAPMEYNPTSTLYEINLREQSLPISSLHDLLGIPIYFSAKDRLGISNQSEPLYLIRIIEQIPQQIYPNPDEADTVGADPTLEWVPFAVPYSFDFEVQVYRTDSGIPSLVWQQNNISSDSIQVTTNADLAIGAYFWTIAVIDLHGNRGRSKEAAFYVSEAINERPTPSGSPAQN